VLANLASIAIIALGVIAALGQIEVATNITQPVLIAVLATVGAILAIGLGGGLVRPMQERWERMLSGAEQEMGNARSEAYRRGQEDADRGAKTPAEAPSPGATAPGPAPSGTTSSGTTSSGTTGSGMGSTSGIA
jgi:hypothetical protein